MIFNLLFQSLLEKYSPSGSMSSSPEFMFTRLRENLFIDGFEWSFAFWLWPAVSKPGP